MELQIWVEHAPDLELHMLYRWLASDEDNRNDLVLSVQSNKPSPEHMGTNFDYINALVGNAIALASLVTAIASWRKASATKNVVYIRRDSTTSTLDDDASQDIGRIMDELSGPNHDSASGDEPCP